MRVLIACEFSGIVRDAFRVRGHDAVSCDLLPSERPGPHIQGDVLAVLADGWDLMIAHPPCNHLAASGARWFPEKRADGRQQAAIEFFLAFINAPIPLIAVENPVGIMSTLFRKPDQIIQPWQFGFSESKATCLWLKGLSKLAPTNIVEPVWWQNPDGTDYKDAKGKRYSQTHFLTWRGQLVRGNNQTTSGQNKIGPSPDRWKIRSRTHQGIADAMAAQWFGDTAVDSANK